MPKTKNIFVSPLNWGIGHATRCVPVIKHLLDRGVNVLVGSDGHAGSFLKNEFPELKSIPLPSYNIVYPSTGNMVLKMLRQLPGLLQAIKKEHKELEKAVKDYKIDAVISDNRFGVWSKNVPSIYITHQVTIKTPPGLGIFERPLYQINQRYIRHFDECWIPDGDSPGLSGDLGHKHPPDIPHYYIGPLSRFTDIPKVKQGIKYDLMIIISGPEPQRAIFEKLVLDQLEGTKFKALVLLGRPDLGEEPQRSGSAMIYPHMPTNDFLGALLTSSLVICRPGYSSIMDLASIGKQAVFVPTPGQTEQEYLASYHMKSRKYFSVSQQDFNIEKIVRSSRNYPGIDLQGSKGLLEERIDALLSSL